MQNDEIKEILNIERYRNKDGYVENINLLPDEIHKLLDYITNLQQDYKSRIEKATNKVQYIIDIGFDYDGYNDVDNLKILVDELVDLARQTKNILNGKE